MAGSLFDYLQASVFDRTTRLFGYPATWTPSAGGPQQTAQVHFKNPNDKDKLQGINYDPFTYMMEYKIEDFTGLQSSVRSGGTETVNIDGTDYYVRDVKAKYDGKSFYANLVLK